MRIISSLTTKDPRSHTRYPKYVLPIHPTSSLGIASLNLREDLQRETGKRFFMSLPVSEDWLHGSSSYFRSPTTGLLKVRGLLTPTGVRKMESVGIPSKILNKGF